MHAERLINIASNANGKKSEQPKLHPHPRAAVPWLGWVETNLFY